MNDADIRVLKGGGGFRLVHEAFFGLCIAGQMRRKEFQRHRTVKMGSGVLVDDAHSTFAEFLDYPVVRDDLSDHGDSTQVS